MFVRLGIILILTVALTILVWRVHLRVILPELRRRRIERLEAENERLDNINYSLRERRRATPRTRRRK